MKLHILGNDIDTDQIIASQYLMLPSAAEMKKFAFESVDPEFASAFIPGDFIIAGKNFGCGSSREQAPAVIKEMGAAAVIAHSFARIFFRNSINIGLTLIQCSDIDKHLSGCSEISINTEKSEIFCSNGEYFKFTKYPAYITEIISAGGLTELINMRNSED